MGRYVTGGFVGALLLALAPTASAELAFSSQRCDQGGVAQPSGPFTPGGEGICRYGVFRMADDGSRLERLTTSLNPGEQEDPERSSSDTEPAWSPTGTDLVFQRNQQNGDSYARLFVMAANGSLQRRLIRDPGLVRAEREPAWSPLGTHIAFAGYEDIPGQLPFVGIFSVRADGSGLRRVSLEGRGAAGAPVFMPDGRLVYYERSTPGPKHPQIHYEPDRGLVSTDITGQRITPLTFGEATPYFYDQLAFSPDGRYLATHTTLMGNQDARIWLMRLDTGKTWPASEGPIGPDARYAGNPTFSLLGPALFYTDGFNTGAIKRVALREGAAPASVSEGRVYSLDWSLLGGVLPRIPEDVLPPAVALGGELPGAPAPRRRIDAAQSSRQSRIPFFAVDYSGIARLDAAVGLRVKGGCRFLRGAALGKRRSCSKPQYSRVKSVASWRDRTAKLPKGRYDVRFRATDVEGNRTRKPRREVVRLK